MAKPEKRWQLLLVADDGRIVPFKRIKGIAVTLVGLLAILGLVCAGLGWQLTAEKVRHRRTLSQLADANRQVIRYKSEHELIAAELVLAEARMEKAGLLVPNRQAYLGQQAPEATGDAKPVPEPKMDESNQAEESKIAASPTTKKAPAIVPAATAPASVTKKAVPEAAPVNVVKAAVPEVAPAEETAEPKPPAVTVDDLQITHDTGNKTLLARFRVKNTGPRSSPVVGRCVVVLKSGLMDAEAWLAMPGVTFVNGEPDGLRGQAFNISRFKDMEIKAMGQTDPSSFKTATVYVFDSSGARILEKDFPIDLPAPPPNPESVSTPAVQSAPESGTAALPVAPEKPTSQKMPVDQPAPDKDPGEAVGQRPMVASPESAAGAAPQPLPTGLPEHAPSVTEGAEPKKQEDTRSRF